MAAGVIRHGVKRPGVDNVEAGGVSLIRGFRSTDFVERRYWGSGYKFAALQIAWSCPLTGAANSHQQTLNFERQFWPDPFTSA